MTVLLTVDPPVSRKQHIWPTKTNMFSDGRHLAASSILSYYYGAAADQRSKTKKMYISQEPVFGANVKMSRLYLLLFIICLKMRPKCFVPGTRNGWTCRQMQRHGGTIRKQKTGKQGGNMLPTAPTDRTQAGQHSHKHAFHLCNDFKAGLEKEFTQGKTCSNGSTLKISHGKTYFFGAGKCWFDPATKEN